MVRDNYDLFRIPDFRIVPELSFKDTDTTRATNVMGQKNVGVDPNIFSCFNAASAACPGKYLLSQRHMGPRKSVQNGANANRKPEILGTTRLSVLARARLSIGLVFSNVSFLRSWHGIGGGNCRALRR